MRRVLGEHMPRTRNTSADSFQINLNVTCGDRIRVPTTRGACEAMLQILVVDDDEHVAAVLKSGLEEYCGVSVTCADTGATASQLLAAYPPDLAVIDVMLPDMSGLELAE